MYGNQLHFSNNFNNLKEQSMHFGDAKPTLKQSQLPMHHISQIEYLAYFDEFAEEYYENINQRMDLNKILKSNNKATHLVYNNFPVPSEKKKIRIKSSNSCNVENRKFIPKSSNNQNLLINKKEKVKGNSKKQVKEVGLGFNLKLSPHGGLFDAKLKKNELLMELIKDKRLSNSKQQEPIISDPKKDSKKKKKSTKSLHSLYKALSQVRRDTANLKLKLKSNNGLEESKSSLKETRNKNITNEYENPTIRTRISNKLEGSQQERIASKALEESFQVVETVCDRNQVNLTKIEEIKGIIEDQMKPELNNEKLKSLPIIKLTSNLISKMVYTNLDDILNFIFEDLIEDSVESMVKLENLANEKSEKLRLVDALTSDDNLKTVFLIQQKEKDIWNRNFRSSIDNIENFSNESLHEIRKVQTRPAQKANSSISLRNKVYGYAESYKDYQNKCGIYFTNNIFVLYKSITTELLNEVLGEELHRACKIYLDRVSEELLKNECLGIE